MARLHAFLRLTAIQNSLFALPWLFITLLLALSLHPRPISLGQTLALVAAFLAARSFGMGCNQLIDREIDAKNPRTVSRVLPRGMLIPAQVIWFVAGSALLFLLFCASINTLCLLLSPLALALIFFYSYTKRFTSLAHLILGSIYVLLPLFVWAALTGTLSWEPLVLGGAFMCSIAGSDIVYAIQDRDFDRANALYSIPAALGVEWAKRAAALLHLAAVGILLLLGVELQRGGWYFLGVLLAALVYLLSHRQLWSKGEEAPGDFLFFCNAGVSFALLLGMTLEWMS